MKINKILPLLLAMTEKEIKVRYKNAFLGFLWIFLNPLFQMLVIGFVFQNFINLPIKNYYLFLFAGLLPWNFFSLTLIKATPSIVVERNLIQKANFPREVIPLSIVLSNFFHFLIAVILLVAFLIITNNFHTLFTPVSIVSLVISLFWILMFTSGLSLLSSALNVRFRDVNFFVQALVILWFYLTPVIYSISLLPVKYLHYLQFNPLFFPFELFRFGMLNLPFPAQSLFLPNFLISLVVIVLGAWVFKKDSLNFSDWL